MRVLKIDSDGEDLSQEDSSQEDSEKTCCEYYVALEQHNLEDGSSLGDNSPFSSILNTEEQGEDDDLTF